jgi:hypothetical protein
LFVVPLNLEAFKLRPTPYHGDSFAESFHIFGLFADRKIKTSESANLRVDTHSSILYVVKYFLCVEV